jgi:hypothetical protein
MEMEKKVEKITRNSSLQYLCKAAKLQKHKIRTKERKIIYIFFLVRVTPYVGCGDGGENIFLH